METQKSQTVGAAALALQSKGDQGQSVIDTERAMQARYRDNLIECAMRHAKKWSDPFYICVQNKKERLLPNVIRQYFYARQTRPEPQYDLALYSYDPKEERMKFEWIIPDQTAVDEILKQHQEGTLPQEYWDLARMCVHFSKRTLV